MPRGSIFTDVVGGSDETIPCCWRESKQGTQAEASWLQVSGEGTVGVEAKEAKPVATRGGPPSAPAALRLHSSDEPSNLYPLPPPPPPAAAAAGAYRFLAEEAVMTPDHACLG